MAALAAEAAIVAGALFIAVALLMSVFVDYLVLRKTLAPLPSCCGVLACCSASGLT